MAARLASAHVAEANATAAAPAKAPADAPADAQSAANAELEAGLRAYAAKDFAQAIEHFARAYSLSPSPESLYAWAQAARSVGDCATAVTLYRRFIDEGATGDPREAAVKNEARCLEQLEGVPEPVPAVAPGPATPRKEPPPPVVVSTPGRDRDRAPVKTRDAVGIGLLSGAGAAAVAGVVVLGLGLAQRAEQAKTHNYDHFADVDGRIDRLYVAAGVTLGVALALAVTGGVRLGLTRRRLGSARRR